MSLYRLNGSRKLDPLYSAYTLSKHKIFTYPYRPKATSREFIDGRYRKAIAVAHRYGICSKIGNVERVIPASEFCIELKILYDFVITRYSGEAFAFLMKIVRYVSKMRSGDYQVFIHWNWWKQLRDINKIIKEGEDVRV